MWGFGDGSILEVRRRVVRGSALHTSLKTVDVVTIV